MYVLTIKTTDKGVPEQSTTSTVTIVVTDVNDNDPECKDITVSTSEDIQINTDIVATVKSTDIDSGDNGKVMYSISGGNVAGKFKIDEVSIF